MLNFTTGRLNALCQQRLDPYGLSLPQWVILSCLWRDGALPVGTLADLVGTGLPAASRLVDRMVERGLVTRQKTKEDGRVMIVQVTDKGAALDHLSGFHLQINEALFAGFSDQERAQAFDLLHRMQANAEAALQAE
ncbi:MAG: MarR family transcriptional regulator [Pseudomonadota bacterium]